MYDQYYKCANNTIPIPECSKSTGEALTPDAQKIRFIFLKFEQTGQYFTEDEFKRSSTESNVQPVVTVEYNGVVTKFQMYPYIHSYIFDVSPQFDFFRLLY